LLEGGLFFNLDSGGVCPQLFETVNIAGKLVKNVKDDITKVHQGPLTFSESFDAESEVLVLALELRDGPLRNGFDVAITGAGCKNQHIGVAGSASNIDDH
jgi:hypothetical protein